MVFYTNALEMPVPLPSPSSFAIGKAADKKSGGNYLFKSN